VWYFSYGTDLSDGLLSEWSRATGHGKPDLRDRRPAVLPNHRICFSVYDGTWGGGVADVVRQVGKSVSGVLVEVGPGTAALLDRLAGRSVDRSGRETGVRRRQAVPVILLARAAAAYGNPIMAHTYLLQRSADRLVPPAARYLQGLTDAAARVGLSDLWLMQLISFGSPAAEPDEGPPSAEHPSAQPSASSRSSSPTFNAGLIDKVRAAATVRPPLGARVRTGEGHQWTGSPGPWRASAS
jgi:hypothetical protein